MEKQMQMGVVTVIRTKTFGNDNGMFVDIGIKTDLGVIAITGFRVGYGKNDKPYVFTPDKPRIATSGRNKGKVEKNDKGFPVTDDVAFFVHEDELEDAPHLFAAKVKRGITSKFRAMLLELLAQECGGEGDDDTQSDDDIPMMD